MGSQSERVHCTTEPIAIIGMSCKFGGDASNTEKLWKLLADGKSAWSEIPSSRFNIKGAYHPKSDKLSTTHAKGGHFMEEDLGLFDAGFFSYSAETAASLDPSFRLQLESTYEALETAGQSLSSVAGTNTSVYAGAFFHDYRDSMIRDEDNLPRLYATGTGTAMAANRISHFFDFRGPSMTIDTGCSTTLTALHQAIQGLRLGEADMSIVGGANILLNPDWFKAFSSIGFLSPEGKSFAFDSRASGYGRGEGVATIVIKRLKDAVEAGDPIRAIIRESMLNQDGKTETITSPSSAAQEALIRGCYRKAGLNPLDTQYFEAHGTGTPTGDPIEAAAVAQVFQEGRTAETALRLGSIKSNLGHTETASGLASIIKVAMALEKGILPPSINFEKPNPKLSLDEWNIKIVRELEPWPESASGVRRASINNFGYGGSNAHIIMEDARMWQTGATAERNVSTASTGASTNATPKRLKSKVLILSGRDEQACRRTIDNIKEYLRQHQSQGSDGEQLLQRLAYTMGQRRTIFPWVAAHPVPYTQGIDAALKELESTKFTPARSMRVPRIGMVFTGQGAQWHAMGRELIIAYPLYRASLEEADGYLREFGVKWSVIDELCRDADATRVNEAALSTPICVAVQISLVRLLQDWGVAPAAVTSHSSGEIAAAFTVGALSYREAMAVAYYRGKLVSDERYRGAVEGSMAAIGVGIDQVNSYLERLDSNARGKVVAACINSPSSVTVAGDLAAIEQLENMAKEDDIFVRRLRVDKAFHSHHMVPIAEPYKEALRNGIWSEGRRDNEPVDLDAIAFSCPVTGGRISSAEDLASEDHWVESLLAPVRFTEALTDMILGDFDPSGSSVDVLIEVGPHTALGAPIRETLAEPEFNGLQLPYYGCLVRGSNALVTMQILAASLARDGHQLKMEAVNFPYGRPESISVLYDLPTYPWNHVSRHWQEPRFSHALRERSEPPHEMLGSRIPGTNQESPVWKHTLRVGESSWIRDHVVQSNILYPAAGFICLAIEAVAQMARSTDVTTATPSTDANAQSRISGYRLKDIDILQALVIPDTTEGIEIQTRISPVNEKNIGTRDWKQFEVFSVTSENRWLQHAKGIIKVEREIKHSLKKGDTVGPEAEVTGYVRNIEPGDMYAGLRFLGLNHGTMFQNVKTIFQSGKDCRGICDFVIADTFSAYDLDNSHILHPTTLDSVIQAAYTTLPEAGAHQDTALVPKHISHLWVSDNITHSPGHSFRAYAQQQRSDQQGVSANVIVANTDDLTKEVVLRAEGVSLASIGRAVVPGQRDRPWDKRICTKPEWMPDMALASKATYDRLKSQLAYNADKEESDIIMDLRRLCILYLNNAVQAFTASDADKLDGHLAKYFLWAKEQIQLAKTGKLGPRCSQWLEEGHSEYQSHIDRIASATVNGEMVCRLGPHLVPVLRGEESGLELMLEGKLLHKYYQNAFKSDRTVAQMVAVFRQLIHKNPRARILEIGAGTGSATRNILKVLGTLDPTCSSQVSYHYTDMSSGFFETAREEFAEWSEILTFAKLDIEQDPTSQGFILGHYDIVIAFQVLHATKTISETLANVRSLMVPDGVLLLTETTHDQLDLQFFAGLLSGWWLGGNDGRHSSPSLATSRWDQALRASGFSGVDLELRDCDDADLYSFSVICSQALPPSPPGFAEEVVFITTNNTLPPVDASRFLENASIKLTGKTTPSFQSLAKWSDEPSKYQGKICVFLGELEGPLLHGLDSVHLSGLKSMATNCKGLLWVTQGGLMDCAKPELSLSTGLLRTLRNEYVGRKYVNLDLDPRQPAWSELNLSTIIRIVETSFGSAGDPSVAVPAEFEYAERDGIIFIPRYYHDAARNKLVSPELIDYTLPENMSFEPLKQEDRPLKLQVGIPGVLDTLVFVDDPAQNAQALAANMIEIEPKAYGVNFRDVMVAMGQLNESIMGVECAGVITRLGSEAAAQGYAAGDRVFCIMRGNYASRVMVQWHVVAHMPADMSFEDAASLGVVFCTAYLGLCSIARLQAGQSVLIHAAAGGVGQAAIMLAQHIGAKIFATVGSPEKAELLTTQYGIPPECIFSSRDTSFGSGILRGTQGRGVDVVFNSLAGPLLQEGFNILAPFGHFIEIGKRDLEQNNNLELGPFARHATFASIDLLALGRHRPQEIQRVLAELVILLQNKTIKPIAPITVFPLAEIGTALRLLQTGKHMGKVVLSVGPQQKVPVLPRAPTARLSPEASYLLVGGLGGIGMSIAHWLIGHGAKNLILLSRNAGVGEKATALVADLEQAGCRVKAISCDVSDEQSLSRVVEVCNRELPPIRGIIHSAMLLQDSIFENMNIDDYRAAILPKVNGSLNLHSLLGGDLDFFIMLSSSVGVLGYPSQANYAAGCAFQDALARYRVSRGLPGVAIDLSAVKGVGYVAERPGIAERMAKLGFASVTENQVLRVIESGILDPHDPQVTAGLDLGPGAHWDRAGQSQLGRDARFSVVQYHQGRQQQQQRSTGGSGQAALAEKLANATSRDEAEILVSQALKDKLASIFMIDIGEIDMARTPSYYGVDSLVAVELRSIITLQAAAEVSIFEILQSTSLDALARNVAARSSYVNASLFVS